MPAGWYDDPFGRHAARFYDGVRWMPHVRDGDRHGTDDPADGAPAVGSPLTAPVLVVRRRGGARDGHDVLDDRGVQTKAWGHGRVGLEGPHGFAGYVVAEDWSTTTLRVEDRAGHAVARVTASPTGDGHVVSLEESLTDPLRSLATAATLGLEAAFRQGLTLPGGSR